MSLEQQKGDHVFTCDGDGCHEFIETGTSNFDAARSVLHEAGWKARKAGNSWEHYCKDCQ